MVYEFSTALDETYLEADGEENERR